VATADVETTLARLCNQAPLRPLVVTDPSRGDLLLALASASDTVVGPHIAGILCTNSQNALQDIGVHVQRVLEVWPCTPPNPAFPPADPVPRRAIADSPLRSGNPQQLHLAICCAGLR
jgi:hypothetical protein